MPLRVFLTGVPGIGKSTVVREVADRIRLEGVRVGGMTSGDLRSGPSRIGFEIRDVASGVAGVLAHVNQPTGPRIGKYRVKTDDLDRVGTEAILFAIRDADLIVIDEVGPMELTSRRFRDAVQAALTCDRPLLGTLHRHAQDPLVQAIRSNHTINVIEVTNGNRNSLPDLLVERLKTG